jgi:hypothetical protein
MNPFFEDESDWRNVAPVVLSGIILKYLICLGILIAIVRHPWGTGERVVISLVIFVCCQINCVQVVFEKAAMQTTLGIHQKFTQFQRLLKAQDLEAAEAWVKEYDARLHEKYREWYIDVLSSKLFALSAVLNILYAVLATNSQ